MIFACTIQHESVSPRLSRRIFYFPSALSNLLEKATPLNSVMQSLFIEHLPSKQRHNSNGQVQKRSSGFLRYSGLTNCMLVVELVRKPHTSFVVHKKMKRIMTMCTSPFENVHTESLCGVKNLFVRQINELGNFFESQINKCNQLLPLSHPTDTRPHKTPLCSTKRSCIKEQLTRQFLCVNFWASV